MNNKMSMLILSIVLLSGCGEMTSGRRFKEFSRYVSGILEAGSYLTKEQGLKVGNTQQIEDFEWAFLKITDAVVVMEEYENEEFRGRVELEYDACSERYVDRDLVMQIKAERCYKLRVTFADGEVVTAQTTVPQLINVLADSLVAEESAFCEDPEIEEWRELELASANEQHPLQIRCASDDEFNLYTEFYCLEEYSQAQYTYPEGDNQFPETESEYMGDNRQYPRRSMSYYMYLPENGLVTYNTYESSILFYGRTRVSVYSIDSNYLNYLYKSDGYFEGGIIGGIGIFASRSGKVLYTTVIRRN